MRGLEFWDRLRIEVKVINRCPRMSVSSGSVALLRVDLYDYAPLSFSAFGVTTQRVEFSSEELSGSVLKITRPTISGSCHLLVRFLEPS